LDTSGGDFGEDWSAVALISSLACSLSTCSPTSEGQEIQNRETTHSDPPIVTRSSKSAITKSGVPSSSPVLSAPGIRRMCQSSISGIAANRILLSIALQTTDIIETRKIWMTTELNRYLDFPRVGQAFVIERRI
jgi:hypothetical protein